MFPLDFVKLESSKIDDFRLTTRVLTFEITSPI